ncbi:MAG: radical SAM protein [Proteobacteria bacterium]|nr:radical SAM protein [Pseudomonadota bacterium]
MNIREIQAKTILRKHKKIDSWFISHCGMNLYQGCVHNCAYCDGRAETYNIQGEFGRDIAVKVNALEILERELDPQRKRVPLKKSFIMVGGGVGDGYQTAERKYQLTRKTLELLIKYNYPAHVLTKSPLVERDVDLLKQINEQSRAIVSFSFSCIDKNISGFMEPGVPSPRKRLETVSRLKEQGITCGMFLMPVIPFLTDTTAQMDKAVEKGREYGVDFVIFSGMTLKPGRQEDFFLNRLAQFKPDLIPKYKDIYKGDKWGNSSPEYYREINKRFMQIARKHQIPIRIPARYFRDIVSRDDRVIIILEQLDFILKSEGQSSPYGYAAYSLSQTKQPLPSELDELTKIKGIGKASAGLILEIMETGTSQLYERKMGP